jgi:capsular polysaccharide biosynthesis protein
MLRESVGYAEVAVLVDAAWEAASTSYAGSQQPEQALSGLWCYAADHWAHGFWHWMHEAMMKIAAVEASGFQGGYIVPGGYEFVDQSMAAMGIVPDRIAKDSTGLITVDRLLVPQPFRAQVDLRNHLGCMEWLRSRVAPSPDELGPARDRTYVARQGARVVLNEPELAELLGRYGFQKVFLEEHDFVGKVAIAARSSAMAGPHGAGLGLSMYMPRRSTLIELMSPSFVNPGQMATLSYLQQRYHMIVNYTWAQGDVGSDVRVPLDVLEQCLEAWSLDQSA